MATLSTAPPTIQRSHGRGYFWAGLGLCLLGLVLAAVQFSLKVLVVPWYTPVLATLGAFELLVSVVKRRTIPRILFLVLVAAFAGLQWYGLVVLLKLPAYEGPAQAGKPLPAFHAKRADGRPFTEVDFRDGSWRVLTFFRGRW